MHKVVGRLAAVGALGAGVGVLVSQPALAAGRRQNNSPIVVQRDASLNAAAIAHQRMQRGDCAGALEAFDAALRTSIDPTLRRDRGLCHEQLGHPYPAIDDYRAYLTAAPDAKDADDIRARLEQLEKTGASGPTASASEVPSQYHWGPQMAQSEVEGSSSGSASGAASSSGTSASASGKGEVKAEASVSVSGSDTESSKPLTTKDMKGRSLDEIEADETLDQDAKNSPLRRGRGFILGPYFQYRWWGIGSKFIGGGYGVGGTFRQSLSAVSTLLLELGYVNWGNSGQAGGVTLVGAQLSDQRQGFDMTIGYEARVRLDARTTNALIITAGGELNKLVYQQTSDSFTTLFVRGRAGFRHVFGPGLGLEAAFDAAYPVYSSGTLIDTYNLGSSTWQQPVLGVYAALVVGF